ncbi:GatB/YqeY domain-containing protein [Alphaproteobacteria bacterium]|nr:GatB/YqeY domain-containing protein [Alphaproteobacteria bacterium]
MNLREEVENKYKEAIKNKNADEINTLRLIKSAIKDKDIAARSQNNNELINDSNILILLQNLIKQRKDSINAFKSALREDLIAIEQKEIDIISKFLPKQMDEKETTELVIKIIKENNLESLKDMGKLMNELKSNYVGSLDMALAGKIAKSKLEN